MSLEFGAKQPYEEYLITFDFVNVMAEDDIISSATVVVYNNAEENVTDTLTDVARQITSGTTVSIWIRGGESGVTYDIVCKIVTSVRAEKYEEDATILVQET